MFWDWMVLFTLLLGASAAFAAGVPRRMWSLGALSKLIHRGFSKDVRHPVLMPGLGLLVVFVVDGSKAAWGPIVAIPLCVLIFALLAFDRWRRTSGSRRPAIVLRGMEPRHHAPDEIAEALGKLPADLRAPFDDLPAYLRKEVGYLDLYELRRGIRNLAMDDLRRRIERLVGAVPSQSDGELWKLVTTLDDRGILRVLVPLLIDEYQVGPQLLLLRRHILAEAAERVIRTRRGSNGFDVLPEHRETFPALLVLLEAGDDVVDVLLRIDTDTADATREDQALKLRLAWRTA